MMPTAVIEKEWLEVMTRCVSWHRSQPGIVASHRMHHLELALNYELVKICPASVWPVGISGGLGLGLGAWRL